MNDYSWLWGALIGAVSGIVGTVIGWSLNRLKRKALNITVRNVSKPCGLTFDSGAFHSVNYYFDLMIYNPSDITAVISDLQIEIRNSEKKLIACVPVCNAQVKVEVLGPYLKVDKKIDVLNFMPKYTEIIKCSLSIFHSEFSDTIGSLVQEQTLIYKDEKKEKVVVPIILTNFDQVKIYKH